MYNPCLTNSRETSLNLGRCSPSTDSGIGDLSIMEQAFNLQKKLQSFENNPSPNFHNAQTIYIQLSEFSQNFESNSHFHRALAQIPVEVKNQYQYTNFLMLLDGFIQTPRASNYKLKIEFCSSLADPKLMNFAPDMTETTFLDATKLEDLLASYILNVEEMNPCCARDWGQLDTAFINEQEFTTHPLFKNQLKTISEMGSIAEMEKKAPRIIKDYCKFYRLTPQETDFVMTHVNQNGALGLIISLIGGVFMNNYMEKSISIPLFIPVQKNPCYNIEKQPGQNLKLSANTDYILRNMDTGVEVLLSKIRLTIEIGNTWKTIMGKNNRPYQIPTFSKIKFEYSNPTKTEPFAAQLLTQVWRRSETRFASITTAY